MKEFNNVLLRLPPAEHKEFKTLTASEGKSMNEVACDLIREYINKSKALLSA